MKQSTALCIGVLSLLLAGSVSLGQDNPLEARPRKPGGGDGGAVQPAGKEKVFVPDFIKPGARLVYASGSSVEGDDPRRPASAGLGLTAYDVVAVLGDRVIMNTVNYLQQGDTYQLTGSYVVVARQTDVIGGGTLWFPIDVLDGFKSDETLSIRTGPLELNGRKYDTTSLTRMSPERASRQVYDRGTGLLLAQQLGAGGPQRGGDPTGFNRKTNSQMTYQSYRVRKLPWADAEPPAWSKDVRRIRYRGRQTRGIPNGPPMVMGFDNVVEFTERGDGWVMGVSTTRYPGTDAPSKSPVAMATGELGVCWISPEALAAMKPGVVEEDETLHTTVRYAVGDGPERRAGVLTETNQGGTYEVVRKFDLRDGCLVYFRMTVNATRITNELSLAGRE